MFFSNEDASEYQVDLHPSSYLVDENLEEDADKEDQHALARAYAQVEELKNAIKKKKSAHFPVSANAPVPPIQVSNSAPANPTSSSEAPTAGKTPVAPNLTDLQKLKPSTNSAPQFHYQSSFDEAVVTKRIVNQVLDTKMEISTKDLFTVSPEIHKQIRELAVTKKITIGSLETTSDATPSAAWASYEQYWVRDTEGKCVGLAMAPLRAVDGILMDKLHVECILDSGCQVVALQRELWDALEAPLCTDMTMTLEAANQSKESTLGVIENATLCIGNIEAHLQIQVIDCAPFDLLLGQPFFCLLSSILHDFPDGEQSLEISNPNSGKQVLIPTQPHNKLQPLPCFINSEDKEDFFVQKQMCRHMNPPEQGF
ncbi:hypothetical protein BKA82DRAFT_4365377 [Pisolithus tinctorius]|nr:hypothetical protein BKA82DRAFT_4365377 [Pisolithus tinctorius]